MTFVSAVKIYQAKAGVTIFVLIACATVSYGPRKRGGEIDSTFVKHSRLRLRSSEPDFFITFLLFAQQAVSGASEAHASLLSRICILLRELSGIRRQ